MSSTEFTRSATHQHLHTLEQQRYAHLLNRDAGAYSRLCHPNLIFLHSTGTIEQLQEFLTPIRNGDVRYNRVDHPIHSVTVVGATAVVVGDLNADLGVQGGEITLRNRIVATWIYGENSWQLLSHVGTAVPQ